MDAALAADSAPAAARGERWTFLAFLRRRPRFLLGYALVLGVAAIGLLSPWLTPYSPVDTDSSAYLVPPSLSRPMGTNSAGLDVLSRVMTAPRVDLTIAVISTGLAALVGAVLGAYIGLWEGGRDSSGALPPSACAFLTWCRLFRSSRWRSCSSPCSGRASALLSSPSGL